MAFRSGTQSTSLDRTTTGKGGKIEAAFFAIYSEAKMFLIYIHFALPEKWFSPFNEQLHVQQLLLDHRLLEDIRSPSGGSALHTAVAQGIPKRYNPFGNWRSAGHQGDVCPF